ncbi:hypothetical protein F4802DRAFT_214719 [Xylaria palmicola]|nr:hypothetical protein F4802DRAFT_214719 [Xylaria palmicola]
MAHGFEKLERLFTGSRRKSQGRQKKARQQNASPIATRRPSSPIFPSPPYLRPTSTHMTPRHAQVDCLDSDKGRAYSVPTLQEALHNRSSVASSITVIGQPKRSNTITAHLRRKHRASNSISRPVRFRFPEDSLFKNDRPMRGLGDSGKKAASRDPSPRTRDPERQGLLDWTPKRVSSLFNPLEFKASSSGRQWDHASDTTESTLLPSPDFVPAIQSLATRKSVDTPRQSTLVHTPSLLRRSGQESTSHPGPPSLSLHKASTDSSPTSNKDEDNKKQAFDRSLSLNTLTMSPPRAENAIPTRLPLVSTFGNARGRRSVRETWGNRLDDPRLGGLPTGGGGGMPQPKLRKSASTSTLLSIRTAKDCVLTEPTFDDFYALSDDDIAESRPLTPSPLTPPYVDTPNSYRKSRLPQALTPQHMVKHTQAEITPPTTPTDCHMLKLTYTPTSPRDNLGALWASILAKKYDFSLIYVLSLWPVGSDCCLGGSANTTPSDLVPVHMAPKEKFTAVTTGPNINGRFLAAYGLNQVPSPFEIAADTHLAALNCVQWNEYRNIDAGPGDISRGWIRPFYNDYASVSMPSTGTYARNRGIVFAAYSKQTANPLIPMHTSPKQSMILRQLYSDARALVEALVKQSFE